jgi:hypothetical protein
MGRRAVIGRRSTWPMGGRGIVQLGSGFGIAIWLASEKKTSGEENKEEYVVKPNQQYSP